MRIIKPKHKHTSGVSAPELGYGYENRVSLISMELCCFTLTRIFSCLILSAPLLNTVGTAGLLRESLSYDFSFVSVLSV